MKAHVVIARQVFLPIILLAVLTGCFRPAIPISTRPEYPVDVFFEDEKPDRPYSEMEWLEYAEEKPLATAQKPVRGGRLLTRGVDQEQKEILLAKLTLEAKKLGADALTNVRYQFYTTATLQGYKLGGMAIRYKDER